MKLFQIEEPDGAPVDSGAPGAAVGIDLAAGAARVAIAVGGNAELLPDGDGNRAIDAAGALSVDLLLALRTRAERQLARPVTHAAIAADEADRATIASAVSAAGLMLLRIVPRAEAAALAQGAPPEEAAVLGVAMIAEDLAPGE